MQPLPRLAQSKTVSSRRTTIAYLTLVSILLQPVGAVFAQPYSIPNDNPGSWDEVEQELNTEIPNNLQQAHCGGWDFEREVHGVWSDDDSTREPKCPPPADEPLRAGCRAQDGTMYMKIAENQWQAAGGGAIISDDQMEAISVETNPNQGLIALVKGVPGRDTERAFGNIRAGLGLRRNTGGNTPKAVYDASDALRRKRVATTDFSGFDYPQGGRVGGKTCGFTTVCRSPGHPDARTVPPAGYRNHGRRDRPGFQCEHPCQRPMDDPGKPQNWDETDSTKVDCGSQEPDSDQIKYSCGGKETKPPNQNFCDEVDNNGQLGGLCQDLNSWVYLRWQKLVHICIMPIATFPFLIPVPIYLKEKGVCGFPEEADKSDHSEDKRDDGWEEDGVFECCSDGAYPGKTYDFDHKGENCIPCTDTGCRLHPNPDTVIVNDIWLEPFPSDLPGQCLIGPPVDDAALAAFIASLTAIGVDAADPGVNIGAWADPDPLLRQVTEEREYISFFRDYNEASYERSDLSHAEDDNVKKNIPVACYGMYDHHFGEAVPEDAIDTKIKNEHKRCTIGAYYPGEDDGDGDGVSFNRMKETQRGKGTFEEALDFTDPLRPFDQQNDLWYPEMGNAFSLINDKVFGTRYHEDLSFTLLTTDSVKQKATFQLDEARPRSSGAVIRTPDDTITGEFDLRKERRTIVEWWHMMQTAMHRNFTPPTVRMLLPTTWTIDLNPLDPIYTPPIPPEPGETSPDIRSEAIEVQVQADENLLGTIAAFLERGLLLRMEAEPVPIVVPVVNPTELRSIAQGWEAWAFNQEKNGRPGVVEARRVAADLQSYADHADDVRKLRGELAKYVGTMLFEQKKISKRVADWMKDNTDAYKAYLEFNWGTALIKVAWEFIQNAYRDLHDESAFPWCRNDRFTAPIYSLLDPWLPGRENSGDMTAGIREHQSCMDELKFYDPTICPEEISPEDCVGLQLSSCDLDLFGDYIACIGFVRSNRAQNDADDLPGTWPTERVCDQFFPTPPLLPQLPDTIREPDLLIDFTAFREPQKSVKLPVLKPVQIRIKFNRIKPPGLEQEDEPEVYPTFAPLPALPDSISQEIRDALPEVIAPTGHPDLDLFKDAPIFTIGDGSTDDPFPKIPMPKVDLFDLLAKLIQIYGLIGESFIPGTMHHEYFKFWNSLILEPDPGTEQDCIQPYGDPRCVHFEADLKERLQRIGARPAVFLRDDFRAAGQFRDPGTHGQLYCEREDWSCQLLNALRRTARAGWMLDNSDEDQFDPEKIVQEIRKTIREASDNIIDNPDDRYLYDMPQEQMFDNFRTAEGRRIERRIERFEPEPLEPGETCNDTFCTIDPEAP